MNDYIDPLKVLEENMGYKDGDSIAIIVQDWDSSYPQELYPRFKETADVTNYFLKRFRELNLNIKKYSYIPIKLQNGVDAPKEIYEEVNQDVVFMITAFSLSHTNFRQQLSRKGARIASMPGFSMHMLEKDGPLDANLNDMKHLTLEAYNNLLSSKKVKITAQETDITVEIDSSTSQHSIGMMNNSGDFGNLPGAESYVAPIFEGNSNGFFTIPKGFGVECDLKFYVKNGRITKIEYPDEAEQYYLKQIKPKVFGARDYDVLAEVGVGTNPNVTKEYIFEKGWSTLLAEKIFGSVHIANGNSKFFGGKNDVPIHQDWVIPDAVIEYIK